MMNDAIVTGILNSLHETVKKATFLL